MDNEKELTHIDLFSGIGGFTLAAEWAGFRTIVFCEKEEFCQKVLQKRFGAVIADPEQSRKLQSAKSKQKKRGWIGDCPILISEIRDFDGKKYRGATLLTGGFPCQPFSVAGERRGKEDDRYLWPQMLRVINEAKPRWILAENVPGIFHMALDTVLADLEGEGYTTGTFIIPACGLNAPHRRNRVWIVANSSGREIGGQPRGTLIRTEDKGREDATNRMSPICSREEIPFSTELGQADSHASDSEMRRCKRGGQKQMGKGRKMADGTKGTDSYASDTHRKGLQIGEMLGQNFQQERSSSIRDAWQEDWYEVATRFCRIFNGISDWLDTQVNDVIYYNHETKQKDFIEGVFGLWEAIQSQEIRRKAGRLFQIFDEKNLLPILRKLSEKTEKQGDLSSTGDKIQSGSLRDLWKDAEFRCSSQRRKYQEQLAREFTNLVPSLPHESALEIAQVCDEINIAYLSIASDRVHRLKALGNAIVPQIAFEILKNIAWIENELA